MPLWDYRFVSLLLLCFSGGLILFWWQSRRSRGRAADAVKAALEPETPLFLENEATCYGIKSKGLLGARGRWGCVALSPNFLIVRTFSLMGKTLNEVKLTRSELISADIVKTYLSSDLHVPSGVLLIRFWGSGGAEDEVALGFGSRKRLEELQHMLH